MHELLHSHAHVHCKHCLALRFTRLLLQASMAEMMTDDDIMSMMQEEQVGGGLQVVGRAACSWE